MATCSDKGSAFVHSDRKYFCVFIDGVYGYWYMVLGLTLSLLLRIGIEVERVIIQSFRLLKFLLVALNAYS